MAHFDAHFRYSDVLILKFCFASCNVEQNICIWNEYKTKDKRRHLYQHYSTTSAISATERSWGLS